MSIPASGQAQTVLDALREKAESLEIRIVTECRPETVERDGTGFCVRTSCGAFRGDFLILAAGSKAAPSTGSDGSGYDLAASLGHKIVKPLPALVQLKCRGDFFRSIAGVRTEAEESLFIRPGSMGAGRSSGLRPGGAAAYGITGSPGSRCSR